MSLVKEHRATSPENAGNLDQVKTDALQLRGLISAVLIEVEEKCDSQTLDQVRILQSLTYSIMYTFILVIRKIFPSTLHKHSYLLIYLTFSHLRLRN